MQGKEVPRCILHLWQACMMRQNLYSDQQQQHEQPNLDLGSLHAPSRDPSSKDHMEINTRVLVLGRAVRATLLHSNSSATPSFTSHTPQICRMWIHTGRTAGGSTCESWLELAHDFICGVKKALGYVCIANSKRIMSKHARMQEICSQSARYR